MKYRISRSAVFQILIAALLLFLFIPYGRAERTAELRDKGLWIISDSEGFWFKPLSDSVIPKVAALSPDGEWVAFARHTGGGFEGEGESCYVARWNGEDEYLLHETDWSILAIYWLEAKDTDFVVIQQGSTATSYRSHFTIVDFQTDECVAQFEGMIYGVSRSGSRHVTRNWNSIVGLRYEILGPNEEPCGWSIFYVDELIWFEPPDDIDMNGVYPVELYAITDGSLHTCWLGESDELPSIEITFKEDAEIRGICIQSGYQYHYQSVVGLSPWDSFDYWPLYDRPKDVLVTFPDGTSREIQLDDTRSVQWIYFEDSEVDSVTLTVMSVYRGIEFDKVAISEIFTY